MSIVSVHGATMGNNRYPTFVYDTECFYDGDYHPDVWSANTSLYNPLDDYNPDAMYIPNGWYIDSGNLIVPPGMYTFNWYLYTDTAKDVALFAYTTPSISALIPNTQQTGTGNYVEFINTAYSEFSFMEIGLSGTVQLIDDGTSDCKLQFSAYKFGPSDIADTEVYQTLQVIRLDV
jgi:hypothetical protein